MTVIGVDPRWEHEAPVVERHTPDELDAVLPRADVVIATTPHTPETEGMWNARRFRLMKPTAFFINIGRGRTTKLDDLTAALERGEIAGCGLDVFEIEPLPAEHPLWALPERPADAAHRRQGRREPAGAALSGAAGERASLRGRRAAAQRRRQGRHVLGDGLDRSGRQREAPCPT